MANIRVTYTCDNCPTEAELKGANHNTLPDGWGEMRVVAPANNLCEWNSTETGTYTICPRCIVFMRDKLPMIHGKGKTT